ncbi:HNH endonuclease [Thiomonas intermedia]|uniref:HNH endonuclease n=1 Tax=Thiomonas intermedia TaxID=926 RepID=UPI001C54F461
MQLDASLAVEHVQPKKPPGAAAAIPERELDWDNFLLACTNCNSTKGDTDVVLNDYLWPDRDDTFHALRYSEGGVVESVPGALQVRSDRLIKLVGLHVRPDTLEASDRRWLNRREAWDMAVRAKDRLARCPLDATQVMRAQIIETAQAKGFWSVWMTVFADDPAMRDLLLQALPGTNTGLF